MNKKISLIGAGSGVFSLSLIRDLCLTPNLEGCTVCFMDINLERLEGSYNLCRRYAAELGINLSFEKTMDRQAALQGSDFIVNTALVANHQRLQAGWEIARRYGYRWGGSLAIMHDEAFWINYYQLNFFESLAQDILKICPQAWYIQVANPVFGSTTFLTRKYPQLKMVGLCHGFSGVYFVAKLLGLDQDGLTFEAPGVNHFIWLTKMNSKGQDAMPLFSRWVEQESTAYFKTCRSSDAMGPKSVDIYKRFGVVPIGDTATVGGGAWGWWYHIDEETERYWKEDPGSWWNGHFLNVERTAMENYRISSDPEACMLDYLEPKHSDEQMVPIIESIACNLPRTFIVNIPNTGGYVPGIPVDVAVEVPALVSSLGIQGIKTDGLPTLVLNTLLRDRVTAWELEIAAYEGGSHRLLVELVTLDPWTRSLQQARNFLEELFYLPFHDEIRAHYR